jgi:hypothetical protein
MKRLLIISGLLIAGAAVYAQTYEADAAHMMRPDLTGTARSLGAGGAFSTVGADQSSVLQNPAGLALYRSHEFSFTGGAIWGNTNTNYLGQSSTSDFAKATLSQAGFVFASKNLQKTQKMSFNNPSKLSRVVVGIGFQKLADFRRTDNLYAVNNNNSYAQALSTNLNSSTAPITLDNFDIPSVQAYQTYVSDFIDTTSGRLGSKMGLPVTQVGTVTTKGTLNDINLTLGFNIDNTVYLGFGLGVPYMSYSRYSSFTERNTAGDSSYTSNYDYSLSGVGVNGKFGIIVKPVQWLRLGASVQTPSYFKLDERTEGNTTSNFAATTYFADTGSVYRFTYNNPLNATFGASFYIKQWAFISVDYEMNDYSHTRYRFDGLDKTYSDQENLNISAKYKLASTVKAGAEFAYKSLRLRAGFAWSESPFRSGVAVSGYDGARFNYTAGIGYRGRSFFADLAYVRTQYKDYYTPYRYTDASGTQEPGVYNTFAGNMIVATIGFKFGLNRN